jgi:hypothetical protein
VMRLKVLGSGHMKSLVRPDANTMSVRILAVDLDGKRQDILIEIVPGFAGWLRLPMSITAPYPLAASADYELVFSFSTSASSAERPSVVSGFCLTLDCFAGRGLMGSG